MEKLITGEAMKKPTWLYEGAKVWWSDPEGISSGVYEVVRVPVDPDDGIIEDDTVILIANGYSEAEVWIEELKPI